MNEYEVEVWHSGDEGEGHVYAVTADTVADALCKTFHHLGVTGVDPTSVTYIRVLMGLEQQPDVTLQ